MQPPPGPDQRAAWAELYRSSSKDLEERLARSFAELESYAELAPEWLRVRPSPDRWSLLEILEHVGLVQHFLLRLIRKIRDKSRSRLAAGAAWPTAPPRLAALDLLATDRSPWAHPPHMSPRGLISLTEIRGQLHEQHGELVSLLRSMPAGQGSLHRIRMSRLEGDDRLDLHGYIGLLDHHARRHLVQIGDNERELAS